MGLFKSLDVSIFNCSYLSTNIHRPSLLFATSSALSPVYSYGGGSAPQRRFLICRQTSTVHLYSPRLRRRYRRSILTAVMLGSVLHCYRVPGIRWHNNRRLALWSRLNVAGLQLLLYGLFSSLWEIPNHCYERLYFIVMRDSESLLWEIPNHCYERLHFIVMRDYTSLLWEIPNHCYERFQIIVMRD